MLDVRRFFQDDDNDCATQLATMPSSVDDTSHKDDGATNVHLVNFSRAEIARNDTRFPQVEEILERLDINSRAVSKSARWPDV